jgi:ABC-type amino acid transport substrate-binding protein
VKKIGYLWVLVVFSSILFNLRVVASEKLRVGYFDLPPHVSTKVATLDNPAIIYLNKILAKGGITATYESIPLSRLLKLLANNEIDAALILGKNSERESYLDFPAINFMTTQPAIVLLSNHRIDSFESLSAALLLTIAAWSGGYHSPLLDTLSHKIVPIYGDNVENRALNMVVQGKVDAFYSPDIWGVRNALSYAGEYKDLKIIPFKNETVPLFTAFSRQAGKIFKPRYETYLNELRAEVSYESLLTVQ